MEARDRKAGEGEETKLATVRRRTDTIIHVGDTMSSASHSAHPCATRYPAEVGDYNDIAKAL